MGRCAALRTGQQQGPGAAVGGARTHALSPQTLEAGSGEDQSGCSLEDGQPYLPAPHPAPISCSSTFSCTPQGRLAAPQVVSQEARASLLFPQRLLFHCQWG